MNSPRYAPAGLLIEQGRVRVAIDGGPGADPAGPLAAWLVTDERAELTASMQPGDYIDAGWREIAALVPTLARGWCGILRGD